MNIEDKIKRIRKICENENFPIISKFTEDFLVRIIKEKKPGTVLEIGTAIGYSGSVILNSCGCNLTTIEIKEDSIKRAKENFESLGFSGRYKIFSGDACDIVPKLTGKYDFIFLDGPKGQYSNFLPYLADCLNGSGILFCDNIYYHGIVKGGVVPVRRDRTIMNNMRKFINDIKLYKNFNVEEFDCGDGLLIAQKVR